MDRLNPSIKDANWLELRELAKGLGAAVKKHLKGKNLSCLDVGCGKKPYMPLFEKNCAEFIGLDTDKESLADKTGTAEKIPFPDNSFDVVLCTQALQYVGSPKKAVAEIRRVLKKGGLLFLAAPSNYPEFDPPKPKWRFMENGLRILLAGFEVKEITCVGGPFLAWFQMINLWLNRKFMRKGSPKPVKLLFWWIVFPANNLLGFALSRVFGKQGYSLDLLAVAEKK